MVARAWGQPGWADHSGVSRTLTGLTFLGNGGWRCGSPGPGRPTVSSPG
jgi:hypothetical protein